MSNPPVIEFGRKELDPAKEEEYRKKIAEAKSGINALKASTPLGHVEKPRIPIIENQRKSQEPSGLSNEGGVVPRPPGSPAITEATARKIKELEAALANGSASVETSAEEDKKIEEAKKDLEDEIDENDLGPRNEAELILANQKRRKEIESRCEDMNVEDLILKGEVRQVIPIIADKFIVTLRSTLPDESLFIKRKIAEGKAVSDQHTLERYALLNLCCSLVQINGESFPNHLDNNGTPDEVLFEKKYSRMMKLSGYVINDLVVNLRWFDIRVRRLLSAEKLSNG